MVEGGVRCWGHNEVGQLGDGTTQNRASPPSRDALTSAIGIATGGAVSCAITASHGLRCWGTNQNGQFGDGYLGYTPLPAMVHTFCR